MQSRLTKLLPLVILLLGTTGLQAQLFNFDYFTFPATESVQNSLVTLKDGASLSVHNQAEISGLVDVAARDILINKVDISGSVQFTKKYGSNNSVTETGNAIVNTSDGGFIVVGSQRHPVFNKFGTLIFRLDANGNIVWANWYGDLQRDINAEGFDIEAVSNNEFIVAGSSTSNGQLIALLIDGNGGLSWFKQYSLISADVRVSRQVTELIEDQVRDGYIIAGTQTIFTPNRPIRRQMFTFAVDLNGDVSRRYITYNFGSLDSWNPSFSPALREGNFVVALTTGRTLISSLGEPQSFIAVTELDDNLEPIWAINYFPEGSSNNGGHSIYRDLANERYSVGCVTERFDDLNPRTRIKNSAFLPIRKDGSPIDFLRYKRNTNQESTFMLLDEVNSAYLLKSDNSSIRTRNSSLGLIRTSLSGRSSCASTEAIKPQRVKTEFRATPIGGSDFGSQIFTLLAAQDVIVRPAQCFSEIILPKAQNNETKVQAAAATVSPTLLNDFNSEINVRVNAAAAGQVRITAFDLLGRQLQQQTYQADTGLNTYFLDGSELPKGITVIVIEQNNAILAAQKIVKE